MDNTIILLMVIGITELAKRTGMPKKFLPLINLVFGIAAGILYISPYDWRQGLLQGIIVGLVASGTWSTAKNVYEGLDKQKTG